jgi:hypothetical protein
MHPEAREASSDAAARAPTPPTRGTRSDSSPSPDSLHRVLADVRSGISAGAFAAQTGASHNRVLAQLHELGSSGTVQRSGSRRSTLLQLISDEKRIAQRAAEIERLACARHEDRTQRRGRAWASLVSASARVKSTSHPMSPIR